MELKFFVEDERIGFCMEKDGRNSNLHNPGNTNNRKKKVIIICIICGILMIGAGVVLFLTLSKSSQTEDEQNERTTTLDTQMKTETVTTESDTEQAADVFFKENGEVISVTAADESKTVLTEKKAKSTFEKRGFKGKEISCEYSVYGKLSENKFAGSDEKHPFYDTYYMNSNGELWTVSIIEDSITAYPVSYNLESELEVEVMISETKEIISYDCEENNFYKSIPKESAIIIVQKNKIDSKLLDELTKEEIDKLVK